MVESGVASNTSLTSLSLSDISPETHLRNSRTIDLEQFYEDLLMNSNLTKLQLRNHLGSNLFLL